jgi:hypothetical protein
VAVWLSGERRRRRRSDKVTMPIRVAQRRETEKEREVGYGLWVGQCVTVESWDRGPWEWNDRFGRRFGSV